MLDGISRGNKRTQKQLMLSLKTKAILILLITLFPIYISGHNICAKQKTKQ